MARSGSSGTDSGPTLATILTTLGGHALHAAVDAGRLDDEIGDLVIIGPGEPLPPAESGLLLLTGATASADQPELVLREAARLGYRAVVVKDSDAHLESMIMLARELGLALLCTPSEMAWRHLDALLTATRQAVPGSRDELSSVGLGDLFALANAIASAVGGAVIIEGPAGQMLGYSSLPHQEIDTVRRMGILGRQAPTYQTTRQSYQRVLASDLAVIVPAPRPEVADRLAVSVRAGRQVLGTIWVIADRPPLVPRAAELLEDAARTAALHLLRARTQGDPERSARGDALRLLLHGARQPRALASRLALPYESPSVVLATMPAHEPVEPFLAAARIIDLVSLYGESWHSGAASVVDSGTVYALLPTATEADGPRLIRLAHDLVSAIKRSAGIEVLVAIGPRADTLADVAGSKLMADRVLRVLAEPAYRDAERRTVADVEAVRSRLLLQALSEHQDLIDDLRLSPVAAVVDHDATHGTSYAETLIAYCGTFGDALRAAGLLTVHENTVRYRVRRAQEIFGIDLTDPDELLITWLQLRLLQLRG
ncbi:PucR family transcriptional regulator [Microlunatus sp. GCM10028923]|uniref:PucR family transcriptional regulator n=1 Tax=Microlunatus sp. GCM10028923 TaxID=3273400 RepID=UPI003615C8F6